MIRFLDSSALIKLFIDETASFLLRDYVDEWNEDLNAFSILAEVEVRSALQRLFRNAETTGHQLHVALAKLDFVSKTWVRIQMDELVIDFASTVISRHALRSLDALQLASALRLREAYVSTGGILFIASDKPCSPPPRPWA